MAYVSIRWGKNAAYHLNYALKDRAPDDAVFAHDCSIENADSDFAAVRAEHNQNGGNHVLHVIQSFSPDDSRNYDAEAFNTLGQKFASNNFPGHQFIIKTHTDTDKIHNHIVINTVNSETGKKIENKRALIYRLQDSSDKLCKEYGLSVINRDAKEHLRKIKASINTKNFNWIFISVWLGLRPQEIDQLMNQEMWKIEELPTGRKVLWVFQTKIIALPPEDRWKPIPILFDEQHFALRIILEKNYKRPLVKTIRKHIGRRHDLYGGRKGFVDLMLQKKQTLENISIWMGHSTLSRTWRSYKNKKIYQAS